MMASKIRAGELGRMVIRWGTCGFQLSSVVLSTEEISFCEWLLILLLWLSPYYKPRHIGLRAKKQPCTV